MCWKPARSSWGRRQQSLPTTSASSRPIWAWPKPDLRPAWRECRPAGGSRRLQRFFGVRGHGAIKKPCQCISVIQRQHVGHILIGAYDYDCPAPVDVKRRKNIVGRVDRIDFFIIDQVERAD